MKEGSSCQDHGELTGVVGVIKPGLVVDIPGVIPPGKTHDAIPGLTPHSEHYHQTKFKKKIIPLISTQTGLTKFAEIDATTLFLHNS